MNQGSLNIYKVSGLPTACGKCGAITDFGRYKYWTAETSTILNTTAFNDLLSAVNLDVAELTVAQTDDRRIELLNDMDFHVLCLEALNGIDQHGPERMGYALNAMLVAGVVYTDIVDEQQRSERLDKLCVQLVNRAAHQPFNMKQPPESDFLTWWFGSLLPANINTVPEVVKERYQEYFAKKEERVGKTPDPKDYDNLEDYVEDAGCGFLYLYLKDYDKFNPTIQRRYRQEKKNLDYVKKSVGVGAPGCPYSEAALINQMRCGLIKKYGMTPEEKLQQLQDLGQDYLLDKVGDASAVLAVLEIISAVLSILMTLFTFIKGIFSSSYDIPVNYEDGIPAESDWNLQPKESTGITGILSKYGIWIAAGIGALLLFGKGNKTN